jgi:hypothetical protein
VVVDGCGGECFVDIAAAEVTFPCGVKVSAAFELEFDAGALGQVGDGVQEGERLEIHD